MTLRFSQRLYSKTALLKAAYHFTDLVYVHLDVDDLDYLVELFSKNDLPLPSNMEKQFMNEILAQTVRQTVSEQTGHLRELIVARAFASTIIEPEVEYETPSVATPPELDEILQDWFEENA